VEIVHKSVLRVRDVITAAVPAMSANFVMGFAPTPNLIEDTVEVATERVKRGRFAKMGSAMSPALMSRSSVRAAATIR